jgi:GrpB-like predicted nucleotidyltransferase (UPF0157 family)
MINACIGDMIIRIEHVGNTSVEGLAAKLIIDIDVVINSYGILSESRITPPRRRMKDLVYRF